MCTRAPTCTGRSSRGWPMPCGRAWSGPPKRTNVPVTEVRVSGVHQSPAAVQLTADVFGLPASRPHTHETSGLGAAIDAAVGLGLHPSFEAAVAAMTRAAETRDPDPANHALYEDLYRSAYLRLVRPAPAVVRGDPADHRVPTGGLITAQPRQGPLCLPGSTNSPRDAPASPRPSSGCCWASCSPSRGSTT